VLGLDLAEAAAKEETTADSPEAAAEPVAVVAEPESEEPGDG
jgi:hypothetical protein